VALQCDMQEHQLRQECGVVERNVGEFVAFFVSSSPWNV